MKTSIRRIIQLKMLEKSTLQAAIRAAFDEVPYPGDDNICPAADCRPGSDYKDIADWLRGNDWRSLHSKLPSPCLWFMTPEAAHYFLPAYLLGATETGSDSTLEDTFLFLKPPGYPEFLALLSPAQKQVIGEFFVYMLDSVLVFLTRFRDQELEFEANLDRKTLDIDDMPTKEEIIEEYNQSVAKARLRFAPLIGYWNVIGTG